MCEGTCNRIEIREAHLDQRDIGREAIEIGRRRETTRLGADDRQPFLYAEQLCETVAIKADADDNENARHRSS